MHTRSIKASRSRSRSASKSALNQAKISKKKSISKTPHKKNTEEEKKSEIPLESGPKSLSSNKKKSYLEIIKEYIDLHDGELLNPEQPEKKECFTLIEDLKIIYEMAKDEQEQSHLSYFWKNLAQGTIKRGVESIRSRYKKFLKFLEKDDFDKVIEHLREKGPKGYIMKFAKSENKRKFVGIIPEMNEKTMSTSNREPPPEPESSSKQLSVEKRVKESIEKKPQNKDFQLLRHILTYEDVILGNRSTVENCWRENEKIFKIDQMMEEIQGELFIQTDFKTRRVLSNMKDQDVALLELHLATLIKTYSLDKKELGEIMMDVSGDLNDLKELLNDPTNPKLKWSDADDEALKNCKSIEDDSFQLLLKYKGKEKIRKRIEFLKLDLPFAVEPPLYFSSDHIFDLMFHPKSNILACCLITGQVEILSYNQDEVNLIGKYNHHKKSCRTIAFSDDGQSLASGSKDKSIGVLDYNGALSTHIKKAHENPINVVKFLPNGLLVSGDDEGEIKIWDLKSNMPIVTYSEQSETITDFSFNQELTFLLSTSVDGTLGVYDLRKPDTSKEKLYALSDCLEEDLLSMTIIKDGKFVLCSSNEGCIYIFKWDWFGDCKDRLLGHPNSVDTIIKLDENTILTGSEDGFLRGVSIYPNKILSILGNHSEDDEHFPIQKLSLSYCRNFVASCSHDNSIKFYEISEFVKQRENLKKEDLMDLDQLKFDEEATIKASRQSKKQKNMDIEEENKENDDNFEDFEENSDDDSEEDEDFEEEKTNKKKKQSLKSKNIKARNKEIIKEKKMEFFSDL